MSETAFDIGEVADRIVALILSGEFAPGERITERRLTELLDCSHSLAREALMLIERRGAVVQSPRRGARVVDPESCPPDQIQAVLLEMLDRLHVLDEEAFPTPKRIGQGSKSVFESWSGLIRRSFDEQDPASAVIATFLVKLGLQLAILDPDSLRAVFDGRRR